MLANYHRWVYSISRYVLYDSRLIWNPNFKLSPFMVWQAWCQMHRQHHRGKNKEIQGLSLEIPGIMTPRRRCAVRLFDQIITFGHVRYFNRRVFLISGTSLNVVNFVTAVWRRDIPLENVQEVASVARLDVKHCIIDCCINRLKKLS